MDVNKWPIFSILNIANLLKIKKICVFGSSGNEAVYITDDDEVFAFGSNCSACLGLGDAGSSFEPKKIEVLCKKNVVDIAFGSGPHVLAVTAVGEVYSWGHNGYCQLGNGGSMQGLFPFLVSTNLQGKKVTKVACGSHHSVALTQEGEIYAWGQNNCGQVGSGTTTNQSTPRKVMAVIGTKFVTSIACGQTSTMALMDSGEVFGWGYNGNGQLGLGNNVNQPNPCKVQGLQGIIISQLVCGYAHTLALSDEGVLYTWGANSYGQLGTGNKANQVAPTRVETKGERMVEVAASHYAHVSSSLTETGNVYMWGQCRSQSITSAILTKFHCTDDVLSAFASPPVTWRIYCVDQMRGSKIAEDVTRNFDDSTTSDIKFIVEGKTIHVHKAILKIRCEHFKTMFQSCWEEDGKDFIEISQFSYNVYRAFLQYLYTDVVDLRPEEAIGLLDLSNSYCECSLKKHCEQIIKKGITVENVAMLYAAAIKFEAKELEDFCFRFALNHMTVVTQSEAFGNLDEVIVKEFIRKAASCGAFKY
ncbi:RCC1 and BTB domain-containing protein 1-like [Mizuhopecten yessoensis]|uniref:RCC1 and BTB domain-containing protein 1-like n=1 Tax=Mizuhopecten yessoensis TaxID=6573 RepID=UPI000B45E703|nr:RCC1 and BTB domain-containing protein 1-like [Mizuhopecten yessoensis]XP_021346917.1 RCC1 and BTB domain-containing protein 1-like [Mizuhopecten yessoensis]